ncbi:hypothetical protein H6G65_18560 [Microcystis elabens FACHB-917]|nr:hypothetical protein [Microcystis elabens FACHB-917]
MLHPLTGQNIYPDADSNAEPGDPQLEARAAMSDLFMAIGKGLFLVFIGYLVVDALPLRLLNPSWQLRFTARLLSLGSIPLIGFACIHLAVIFNPANKFYQQRLPFIRRLAFAAAIGFLLLIPLQGFATWRAYTTAKSNQQTLVRQAQRRVAPLKQAIEAATSTEDLQKKLSSIEGSQLRLAPEDLSRPLGTVKEAILSNLARSENLYTDQLARVTGPEQIWAAIQAIVRTVLASLGFFIGFAAGAQLSPTSPTLQQLVSMRFRSLPGRRRRRRSSRG